jgi:predicted phosphodiesterase
VLDLLLKQYFGAELLNFFRALVPSIAVRGNVDDTATKEELPEHVLHSHLGWDIFVTHVAYPGRGYAVSETPAIQ